MFVSITVAYRDSDITGNREIEDVNVLSPMLMWDSWQGRHKNEFRWSGAIS